MFIQMLWLMFVSFTLGMIAGVLIKGIHVHVNQKTPVAPEELNKVDESTIPPSHLNYINKNQGFIE